MHNTLRLLQPIPLLQLTALLQAIQLVDILQPLMAGRAMATAQDHPTSCAKLSERARLVTVAPTLSPMPNGKPLSSARREGHFFKIPCYFPVSWEFGLRIVPPTPLFIDAKMVDWMLRPVRLRLCPPPRSPAVAKIS
jgi:hypothetical protein